MTLSVTVRNVTSLPERTRVTAERGCCIGDMKLLILQLLQEYSTDAKRALSAIRAGVHGEH